MSEAENRPEQDRLTTGVPGLDAVLLGGFLRRGVYMLEGRPGGGKTILANQLAFHHSLHGGRVLYVTLLAETHERLLQYIRQLSFFDEARIPEQIGYVSGFVALQDGGLKGLAELLRRECREKRASLLVIDGLVAAEERAESHTEFKKFVQELQIHANLLGHTVLMLTTAASGSVRPEHTMVDGVLNVSDNRVGRRAERELEVRKLRGTDYLRGGHAFQISSTGISVFPRLEALYQEPQHDDGCTFTRISTGIATLDQALEGGIRCGSSTVLFGPTGASKTSIGLHFLSRCSAEEPGLLFGFYETPERVLVKAQALGIDLTPHVKAGHLALHWFPSTERVLDALGHRLLESVRARNVKRLFVDGVDGFMTAATYPERISTFLSALTNELRVRGVTTLYTSELDHLFSTEVKLPLEGVSSLVENILLTRFIEQQGHLKRVFSVIKTRDSGYDHTLRELRISDRGIELGERVEGDFGAQHNVSAAHGGTLRSLGRLLRKRGRQS
ncbi:MAG TPA: ATPase domain-containing protein [Polyangiales bacterium]